MSPSDGVYWLGIEGPGPLPAFSVLVGLRCQIDRLACLCCWKECGLLAGGQTFLHASNLSRIRRGMGPPLSRGKGPSCR